jgi:DNA-directed RNA polymerase subunit RPC12/RpoP
VAHQTQARPGSGAQLLGAALGKGSPALRRRVNEVMREGHRWDPGVIPFFCECSRARCDEPLWLTPSAYDQRRNEDGRRLLLPGHEYAAEDGEWADGQISTTERREVRCEACGYGAVVTRWPMRCPMCGSRTWIVVDGDAARSWSSQGDHDV